MNVIKNTKTIIKENNRNYQTFILCFKYFLKKA